QGSHVRNRFTSMDIGMNSQILPDMLVLILPLLTSQTERTRVPIPLMVTGRPMKDAVTGIM
ncbi:hypothetical protein ECO9570_05783, partial [Escherichia coli O111:H8 str. CVM9570]